MITELLPEAVQQPALWSELDRERRERVWTTVDRLNATLGRGTVRILSAGPKDAAWKTAGGVPVAAVDYVVGILPRVKA